MALFDAYRFFISFAPSYIDQQVFPVNKEIEFVNEKKGLKEQRKLATKLVFTNDGINQTFDELFAYERGYYHCTKIKLRVENTYDNGTTWQTCYKGFLRCVDAKWDISHCQVTCDIVPDDIYSCLYDTWEKELPIWITPYTEVFIQPSNGVVFDLQPINLTNISDVNFALDPTNNSLTVEWTVINYQLGTYDSQAGEYATMDILFGRVTFVGVTPPINSGTGWINTGGANWVRPMTQSEVNSSNVLPSFTTGYSLQWLLEWFGGSECWTRPNGNIACAEGGSNTGCGFNVISNFLSINPDNTNPTNSTYQQSLAKLANLFLFQKSDILRSGLIGVQFAKPTLKLKDLLDNLCTTFNLDWWLEPQGFGTPNLRIEHVSYFQDLKMLDLTLLGLHRDQINGKQQYEYKKDKLPLSERWKWQVETDKSSDFDSVPVTYSGDCLDLDTKETIYQVTKFETNIAYLISKINSTSSDATESDYEGFVLVATNLDANNNYHITQEVGYLSGDVKLNAALSWANILEDYHKYNRVLPQGMMNNKNILFASSIKTRQQVPLEVFLCREDYFEILSILHQTKTQFGWGDTDKISYNEPSQTLTIQVSH